MNLNSALARLERAGSEHSRCTAKLREACVLVADAICDTLPPLDEYRAVDLPRGYFYDWPGCDRRVEVALYASAHGDDPEVAINCDGSSRGALLLTRHVALQFAGDVATGLLDEIAEWVERRAAQLADANAKLEDTQARR